MSGQADASLSRANDLDPRRSSLAVVRAVPQFRNDALQVLAAGKVK